MGRGCSRAESITWPAWWGRGDQIQKPDGLWSCPKFPGSSEVQQKKVPSTSMGYSQGEMERPPLQAVAPGQAATIISK